jgi:hypothetical protein
MQGQIQFTYLSQQFYGSRKGYRSSANNLVFETIDFFLESGSEPYVRWFLDMTHM